MAADRNLVAALRHFARHAPGAALAETPASLLVASATELTGTFHQAAIRPDRSADPAATLAEMAAFEAEHGRTLLLWTAEVRDDDLAEAARDAGLRYRSGMPGMAIDAPPAVPEPPAGTALRRVVDAAGVAGFAEVLGRNAAAGEVVLQATRPGPGPRPVSRCTGGSGSG